MIQPEVISLTEAWEMLEHQSAVLVTVNQRLARYLKSQYNDRQSHSGKRAWETPLILPYDSWIEKSYNEAAVSRQASGQTGLKILMSKEQECLVWEQIIRKWDHDQGRRLLLVPETARIAVKAWELCREWRILRHELGQTPSDDTAAFLDWVENFERLCREKGWQDRAGIADAVMDLMKSSQIEAPKQIILAGFDEMPPRKSEMIQVMAASGSGVAMLSNSLETSAPRLYAASDAEAEMAAAARWARACLEENPNSRIGILAPDLETRRPDLIRLLDDVFHPSRVLIPDDSGSRIFNISKGRPLSEYPVARAAFLILNFSYRPLLAAETTELLISPFIGSADSEFSDRGLLDARIRENGEISMTISRLIHCLKCQANRVHDNKPFCKALHQFVQKFQKEADRQNDNHRSSEWAGIFNSLLLSMGWPGDRTLTSEEYQTVEAFKKALSQFAAMDMVASQMDVRTAVAEFTRIVQDKEFQPETGDAPVQVLGILESAGERFTHLWVMGLDAETWPPPARPNPFLPVEVQRRRNIPHGSAERELEFTRRITERLVCSAGQVMFSYPLKDGDAELAPSPLIANFESASPDWPEPDWRMRIYESRSLEPVIDRNGPRVNSDTSISGGTGLLKAQAACPFSAFARFRLGARPLEAPEPGLNARDRGNLVHKSLEFFWERTKTHTALVDLSPEALIDAVRESVDRAVSQMAEDHPRTFTPIFTRIETRRLETLLLEWLAVDRGRSPFTVSGREKRLACTLAGMEMKTFADRIDRLDDGRLVIVDYKTGEPKVGDWFSERIAEPQLPLYSFAVNEPVAGVVFGQIKKGRVKYLGVVEDAAIVPGALLPEKFGKTGETFAAMSEIIAFWKQKIEFLAREVWQGVATVAPVSGKTTCRDCDLGPLCRISEAGFLEKMNAEENP